MVSVTRVVVAMATGLLLLTSCCAKYQEMTHVMDTNNIVFHPVYADSKYHFKYVRDQAGPIGNEKYVAWSIYSVVEHMATHVDAPAHFDPNGRHPADIPLEELHGPLVRIDIKEKAKTNKRATVDIEDIMKWEKKHGKIQPKSFILSDSGWDRHWGNQDEFVGTARLDEPEKLNWPAFHIDTVNWLLKNRDFLGLGTDTLSCDIPPDNLVHRAILISPQSKVCLENLANLGKVPECGAKFYYNPLLMKKATGGQIRAYAHWDENMKGCKDGRPVLPKNGKNGDGFETHGAAAVWQANLLLVVGLLACLLALF